MATARKVSLKNFSGTIARQPNGQVVIKGSGKVGGEKRAASKNPKRKPATKKRKPATKRQKPTTKRRKR